MQQTSSSSFVLGNIAVLATLSEKYIHPENPLGIVENAALHVENGLIQWVGSESQLPEILKELPYQDAEKAVVTPGWIDSHTHPVFAGERSGEYAERLRGVPYTEIAARGGGIRKTVEATRAASAEELYRSARYWLDEMLGYGVTTVEAKSGYGLTTQSELKQLDVLGRLQKDAAPEIVPTFLGAHEFPVEFHDRRDAYVDLIVEEMLPAVAEQGIARFCDVFCEKGWFDVDQSRKILLAAREYGLLLRLHADEFSPSGAAELAAELDAVACDHLMAVSDEGLARMAEKGVIAAVLPGTTLNLGLENFAPIEKMYEAGLKVVLASDFNPGSCVCANLPLIAQLSAMRMRWVPEKLLPAVTLDAARSLALDDRGRIEKGLRADLVLFDAPGIDYLFYHWGRNHAHRVFVTGKEHLPSHRNALFTS